MTIATALVGSGAPGIGVTVTAGATITAIQLFRTSNGVTELTRVQPRTGASTAYVEDYEIPWDVDVVYSATYTASGSHTDTAAAVNLSSTSAWAIHPVFPAALSVEIDRQYAGGASTWVTAVGSVTRATNQTIHQIIGSSYPVVTTTGPRVASTFAMTIATEDEAAIWALVDDQTPILFRFPESFGTNFEDGFYAVGDVSADRAGLAASGIRTFSLPLTRVAAPAVTQQLAWDYPSLTAAYADYGALTAAYADYPALTANRTS